MASTDSLSSQPRPFLSNSNSVPTPLIVSAVISSHSAAPDPPMAALEHVVSERNVLSSQNSQLWKLVEKQRAGYSQILKELERVRTERDAYKAGLQNNGDDPDQILKIHKGKGKSSASGLKVSFSSSGLRVEEQPQRSSDLRLGSTKHQAHDLAQDTMSSSLMPVIGPKRTESLQPVPTVPIPSTLRVGIQGGTNKTPTHSVHSSLVDASSTGQEQAYVTTPALSLSPLSSKVIPPVLAPPIQVSFTPPGDHPHASNMSSLTSLDTFSQPIDTSRESRISLPEEAKRYLAAMGESPYSSPQVRTFGPDSSVARLESPQTLSPAVDLNGDINEDDKSQLVYKQADSVEGEFLDLDDEVSGDDYQDSLGGERSASTTSDREADHSVGRAFTTGGVLIRKPSADDFPMPPSGQPSHKDVRPDARTQPTTTMNDQSVDLKDVSDGDHVSTSSLPSYDQAANSGRLNQSSPFAPPKLDDIPPQPHFRALPLLAADLPHTRIMVSHSSIRPNDRGKEVLSFVIIVDPGSGKDLWKIEKLYSDVIALDQRVKSMSRSLAKKMPMLPESKVWRDHAPAKVDQRKVALESYLRALILLPLKDKNDVIAFFTSDIVRARQPVASAGYKEGYLTKRGKNFGGWKRRYFVLQGSVLEYYESRGGTHLGSISIIGAQIGRQQRTGNSQSSDDDSEYRHAFLIIESKKNTNGSPNRHVLCAESDKERDSWVDILVKYVTGNYQEDQVPLLPTSTTPYSNPNGITSVHPGGFCVDGGNPSLDSTQPRSSTSSLAIPELTGPRKPVRGMSKDDILRGPAVPISQLAPDANNAKLFQNPPTIVNVSSPDVPLSSSLPISSPLGGDHGTLAPIVPRSNSELGHYPDTIEGRSPARPGAGAGAHVSPDYHRSRDRDKRHTSVQPLKFTPTIPVDLRPVSPDPHTPRVDTNGKVKISGPISGGPLPAGYKFGATGKDSTEQNTLISSDRREKAKSRMFWGFGRPSADKPAPAAQHSSRVVFGISIEESLEVAKIANLPAIVFRCIQYLEAKKADQEEGIYRLSGSSAVIKSLKDRFNAEGDVDLLASDEYWDPHAIAGLLKTFMRDLPSSILTRELHIQFLSVIDFVDAQERIKELSLLIAQLPLPNYSLLRALTAHLILIVQNSGVNKMTMRNVGIVFSPTLGIPAGVFSLMLGEFNRVFNVDDSGADVDDSVRRNSRQYSDAAADQLLGLSGRSLKVAAPDDQSDEGDGGDDISIQDDSGTETTDDLGTADLSGGPSGTIRSRMSTIAAKRGLNVLVDEQKPLLRAGLPVSPHPMQSPRHLQPSPSAPSPSIH